MNSPTDCYAALPGAAFPIQRIALPGAYTDWVSHSPEGVGGGSANNSTRFLLRAKNKTSIISPVGNRRCTTIPILVKT